MSLTHEDVQRLLQLLDTSTFDELQLESDGTKLVLRRNGAGSTAAMQPAAGAPQPVPATTAPEAQARTMAVSAANQPASVPPGAGLVDIRASMLGSFYGSPKPGAPSFVEVGSRVRPDTVIGIIEVMKLMNSVSAGVEGEVVEILARDGELVEFDAVLMRVRPAEGELQ